MSIFTAFGQQTIQKYQGNWEGHLPNPQSLSFTIKLEKQKANLYRLVLANDQTVLEKTLKSKGKDLIQIDVDAQTQLKLYPQGNDLSGFIKSGILMYSLNLKQTDVDQYTGTWNPFMISSLQNTSIYLSVENYDNGTFATYPFFGDQRFTGTWCGDFQLDGPLVRFRDFKTGFNFRATLSKNQIQLELLLADAVVATSTLSRSQADWNFGMSSSPQQIIPPAELNDGWQVSNLQEAGINNTKLVQLLEQMQANAFENTHSVLIAKANKLVFEAYFDGYHANIPHDQRSASKSVASAMVGIAIDQGILEHTDQKLYDCIPQSYQYTKDSLKSMISLHHLLTMSSGFDMNRTSMAREGNYQETDNWLKAVLEASMAEPPGIRAIYTSSSPFLLGVCLNERLEIPMEIFMDQQLLAPLGITNYIIQTENTRTTPYFGGGMYLTPRDMLKFGQVYLNKGQWNGQQLLSSKWVENSFKKHTQLEGTRDKNKYGYQWWHKAYTVGNMEVNSIEARGNGGQYIFVMPELESVVVITSGNYRNGKLLQQPEKILETYILPAIK